MGMDQNGKNVENKIKIFVYLDSNIATNASLDTETNSRIGKASDTFSRFTAKVWGNY